MWPGEMYTPTLGAIVVWLYISCFHYSVLVLCNSAVAPAVVSLSPALATYTSKSLCTPFNIKWSPPLILLLWSSSFRHQCHSNEQILAVQVQPLRLSVLPFAPFLMLSVTNLWGALIKLLTKDERGISTYGQGIETTWECVTDRGFAECVSGWMAHFGQFPTVDVPVLHVHIHIIMGMSMPK